VAAGSSQTSGGRESKASALKLESTMARSAARRLITVAQTKRLGSKSLGRLVVAVAVAAVIDVHEDVGAAMQFGVDPARRLELEAAGAGPGDRRAVDAVTRHGSARPCRPPRRSPGAARPDAGRRRSGMCRKKNVTAYQRFLASPLWQKCERSARSRRAVRRNRPVQSPGLCADHQAEKHRLR
jgi:hypothetical protein